GLDVGRVDGGGDDELPAEVSVDALHPHEVARLHLGVGAPVPRDPESSVERFELDVGKPDARELDLEDDLFGRLVNVRGRGPEGGFDSLVGALGAVNRLLEEPVHLLLDRHQILERVPLEGAHDTSLRGYFFSVSTYSVSMTSSSLPEPVSGRGSDEAPPGADCCEDAVLYIASASLCEACCSRSAAWFMLSVPPDSSAFFASASADSKLPISPGSS